jgi:hypothetical protein
MDQKRSIFEILGFSEQAKVTTGDSTDEGTIRCIHCKEYNTHIERIVVLKTADDYETDEYIEIDSSAEIKRVKFEKSFSTHWRNREPSLYIEFSCELCSKKFLNYIAFHKGTNFTNFLVKKEYTNDPL